MSVVEKNADRLRLLNNAGQAHRPRLKGVLAEIRLESLELAAHQSLPSLVAGPEPFLNSVLDMSEN
jgi:hypothetical protein